MRKTGVGSSGGPGDGLRTLNLKLPLPLLSLPIEYELYHVEEEVWYNLCAHVEGRSLCLAMQLGRDRLL